MTELLIALIAAIFTGMSYRWNKRKDTFTFMEQSFTDLQSINEKILESSENITAAIKSVNSNDTILKEDARQIYINYMRINRIFRAWFYLDRKFIEEVDAMYIIDSHIGVLKNFHENHKNRLDEMLSRSYPDDFSKFLTDKLKNTEIPMAFIRE